MLIGHQKQASFFDHAVKNGTLGHAFCLVGPHQVGKRALAKHVASLILGTAEGKLLTSPDYYYLERAVDEKTGKLKKEISVKQARDLRERLHNSSWLGRGQAVIIDEAELLNTEAANALLKVLEEPPKNSIIFLLTVDDSALPATVRSRCQMFYLPAVAEKEIALGLKAMGADDETASDIAEISWGRPGRAVELWQNAPARNDYYLEVERFKNIFNEPFHKKLSVLSELFGKKDDDAQVKRDHWKEVLNVWQLEWRKKLLSGDGRFTTAQMVEIMDRFAKARRLMGENINPRLLIEETILQF